MAMSNPRLKLVSYGLYFYYLCDIVGVMLALYNMSAKEVEYMLLQIIIKRLGRPEHGLVRFYHLHLFLSYG